MIGRKRDAIVVVLGAFAVCSGWAWLLRGHTPSGEWPGVDEAVIAHFVRAAGSPSRPLLDWVRGDALLFAFLVAGLAAGFVLGFFARAALRSEKELS